MVFCTSNACAVSSEHLNYKRHSMVKLLYRFHVYYHVRQVLKRLQVPLPYESGFNAANNTYSGEGLIKLYKDYEVPLKPMRYQNEKFFGTHQHRGWSDYIGFNSMTHWIIKKSQGFTNPKFTSLCKVVYCRKYSECTHCPESLSE